MYSSQFMSIDEDNQIIFSVSKKYLLYVSYCPYTYYISLIWKIITSKHLTTLFAPILFALTK